MRPHLFVSVFAALALVATPAFGQSAPSGGPPDAARTVPREQPPTATIMAEPVAVFIGACDADGDARVTRAELAACTAKSFAATDKDGKGSVGYIQFADWAERWLGDRNALPSPFETDSDGNDRITGIELKAQLDKTFTRLDRDKDGVLVRSELLTIDSTRGLGGAGDRGPRGRRPRQ